jgi:flagellar assembly factor FliW
MPVCQTRFHGAIRFEPSQVLHVPGGMIGLPGEKEFLLLELPSMRPLAFVQSVRTPELCFLALPTQVVEPGYQLCLQPADIEALGYSLERPPKMGKHLLCLALLTLHDKQQNTANLLAPLVIDIARHRGMQVIVNGPYSHQHPLRAGELAGKC